MWSSVGWRNFICWMYTEIETFKINQIKWSFSFKWWYIYEGKYYTVKPHLLTLEGTLYCTKLIVDLQWTCHFTNSIWWPWRDSSLYRQHLMTLKRLLIVQSSLLIFNGFFIVQTAFDDLEGILHCTDSICWFWRDSSLYRHHLMTLKGLFIV